MSIAYQALLYLHIIVGFTSLILFWMPIAARKGSPWHIRSGKWYVNAMYVVAGTALLMSAMMLVIPLSAKHAGRVLAASEIDQIIQREFIVGAFLLAISMLVMTGVRHGIMTLRAKTHHREMRHPLHLVLIIGLILSGLFLAWVAQGSAANRTLFYVFAGLCIFTGIGNLRFSLKKDVARGEWLIEHLGAMIGAGIGSYTAFFVFGANRVLGELLSGFWVLIPWIAPGVLGTAYIVWQTRKYRRRTQSTQAGGSAVTQ